MKFLPGAKVSKGVMIPDLMHRRRADQCSGYTWSLGSQLPTLRCSLQTHLGDPGQVTSLGASRSTSGTSLVVQWLRLCTSFAGGAWVQFPVRKLRSCVLQPKYF